jgi:alkylhydroperoxidase family enzyme
MAFIAYHRNEPRANTLRISTINPEALRAHLDLYRTLVHGESPLSRMRREMIAVAVSQLNGCHY